MKDYYIKPGLMSAQQLVELNRTGLVIGITKFQKGYARIRTTEELPSPEIYDLIVPISQDPVTGEWEKIVVGYEKSESGLDDKTRPIFLTEIFD